MMKFNESTPKWLSEDRCAALNTLLDFKPAFTTAETFSCCTGQYGPFQTGKKIKLPIWLALQLEEKNRGILYPPSWLDEHKLRMVIVNERRDMRSFQPVDEWFVYVGHTLLTRGKWFQLKEKEPTEIAFQELIDVRRHKATEGMRQLNCKEVLLECTNMTRPEITWYRERAIAGMDYLHSLNEEERKGMAAPSSTKSGGDTASSEKKSDTSISSAQQRLSDPGGANSSLLGGNLGGLGASSLGQDQASMLIRDIRVPP
ncbi:unnamed protein product [Amoebophrya sp. A25]|nr:unnamed protein product [Amoebophrya sp. A25]|eukprot:GSA25T00027285001.1